ncbi:MAG TPA: hypothetical protein VFX60_04345 [Micromonospora sp.]|nr:hypothetical protein [Micromonospora sp.]
MRIPRFLVAVAAAPLLMTSLSGCTTTSVVCSTNSCNVSVKTAGQATTKVWDHEVTVSDLDGGSVTMSYGGQSITLQQGEVGELGPLSVEVKEAADGKVKLQFTR